MMNNKIKNSSRPFQSLALLLFVILNAACASQKGLIKPDKNYNDKEMALLVFKEGAEALYKDNQLALEKFNQAKELDKTLLAAFYNAALAYEQLNLLEEASSNYELCLNINPQDSNCLNNLLLIKYKLTQVTYCEDLVNKYLTDFPEVAFPKVLAAKLAYLKNDLVTAEKYARLAIELETENVEALYTMLRIFYDTKQYAAAKFVAKNALAIAPAHGGLNRYQGHTFLALELHHDALDSYEKATKYEPIAESLESYGLLLLQRGKAKEGLEQIEKLAALNPQDPINQLLLGNAYTANKKLSEAVAAYEKALVLKPEDKSPRFNLGLLYFDFKQEELNDLDRFKLSADNFKEFLTQPDLSKEKIDETNKYLKTLAEKIEMEQPAVSEEPEESEEEPKEEEKSDETTESEPNEEGKPEENIESEPQGQNLPEENKEEIENKPTEEAVLPKEEKEEEAKPEKKKKSKKKKDKKNNKPKIKDEYEEEDEIIDEEEELSDFDEDV
jgi:tetratricopeptide (TPR) repeat protein